MAKYTVTIYESLTHAIEVFATSSDEAQEIARQQYESKSLKPSVPGVTEYVLAVDDIIFEVDTPNTNTA